MNPPSTFALSQELANTTQGRSEPEKATVAADSAADTKRPTDVLPTFVPHDYALWPREWSREAFLTGTFVDSNGATSDVENEYLRYVVGHCRSATAGAAAILVIIIINFINAVSSEKARANTTGLGIVLLIVVLCGLGSIVVIVAEKCIRLEGRSAHEQRQAAVVVERSRVLLHLAVDIALFFSGMSAAPATMYSINTATMILGVMMAYFVHIRFSRSLVTLSLMGIFYAAGTLTVISSFWTPQWSAFYCFTTFAFMIPFVAIGKIVDLRSRSRFVAIVAAHFARTAFNRNEIVMSRIMQTVVPPALLPRLTDAASIADAWYLDTSPNCVIVVASVPSMSTWASTMVPMDSVRAIHAIFCRFDGILSDYESRRNIRRAVVSGDKYLVCGGLLGGVLKSRRSHRHPLINTTAAPPPSSYSKYPAGSVEWKRDLLRDMLRLARDLVNVAAEVERYRRELLRDATEEESRATSMHRSMNPNHSIYESRRSQSSFAAFGGPDSLATAMFGIPSSNITVAEPLHLCIGVGAGRCLGGIHGEESQFRYVLYGQALDDSVEVQQLGPGDVDSVVVSKAALLGTTAAAGPLDPDGDRPPSLFVPGSTPESGAQSRKSDRFGRSPMPAGGSPRVRLSPRQLDALASDLLPLSLRFTPLYRNGVLLPSAYLVAPPTARNDEQPAASGVPAAAVCRPFVLEEAPPRGSPASRFDAPVFMPSAFAPISEPAADASATENAVRYPVEARQNSDATADLQYRGYGLGPYENPNVIDWPHVNPLQPIDAQEGYGNEEMGTMAGAGGTMHHPAEFVSKLITQLSASVRMRKWIGTFDDPDVESSFRANAAYMDSPAGGVVWTAVWTTAAASLITFITMVSEKTVRPPNRRPRVDIDTRMTISLVLFILSCLIFTATAVASSAFVKRRAHGINAQLPPLFYIVQTSALSAGFAIGGAANALAGPNTIIGTNRVGLYAHFLGATLILARWQSWPIKLAMLVGGLALPTALIILLIPFPPYLNAATFEDSNAFAIIAVYGLATLPFIVITAFDTRIEYAVLRVCELVREASGTRVELTRRLTRGLVPEHLIDDVVQRFLDADEYETEGGINNPQFVPPPTIARLQQPLRFYTAQPSGSFWQRCAIQPAPRMTALFGELCVVAMQFQPFAADSERPMLRLRGGLIDGGLFEMPPGSALLPTSTSWNADTSELVSTHTNAPTLHGLTSNSVNTTTNPLDYSRFSADTPPFFGRSAESPGRGGSGVAGQDTVAVPPDAEAALSVLDEVDTAIASVPEAYLRVVNVLGDSLMIAGPIGEPQTWNDQNVSHDSDKSTGTSEELKKAREEARERARRQERDSLPSMAAGLPNRPHPFDEGSAMIKPSLRRSTANAKASGSAVPSAPPAVPEQPGDEEKKKKAARRLREKFVMRSAVGLVEVLRQIAASSGRSYTAALAVDSAIGAVIGDVSTSMRYSIFGVAPRNARNLLQAAPPLLSNQGSVPVKITSAAFALESFRRLHDRKIIARATDQVLDRIRPDFGVAPVPASTLELAHVPFDATVFNPPMRWRLNTLGQIRVYSIRLTSDSIAPSRASSSTFDDLAGASALDFDESPLHAAFATSPRRAKPNLAEAAVADHEERSTPAAAGTATAPPTPPSPPPRATVLAPGSTGASREEFSGTSPLSTSGPGGRAWREIVNVQGPSAANNAEEEEEEEERSDSDRDAPEEQEAAPSPATFAPESLEP
jgi:hypothetical protein